MDDARGIAGVDWGEQRENRRDLSAGEKVQAALKWFSGSLQLHGMDAYPTRNNGRVHYHKDVQWIKRLESIKGMKIQKEIVPTYQY